jgi:AMMECR1 domain-containing protein
MGLKAPDVITPWTQDQAIGAALVRRARAAAVATVRNRKIPCAKLSSELIPTRVAAIGVTLYRGGVCGCCISTEPRLDDAVVAAAAAAARDRRFHRLLPDALRHLHVVISVLYDPQRLGPCRKQKAAGSLRVGRDTLAVSDGARRAMFLDFVASHHAWSKLKLVTQLLRKAQLTNKPVQWTTYRTASWLEDRTGARAQQFGFSMEPTVRCTAAMLRADVALMGRFLARNLMAGGQVRYAQLPVTGWHTDRGPSERAKLGYEALGQAARILRRADWRRQAESGLRSLSGPDLPDLAADTPTSRLALIAGGLAEAWLLALAHDDWKRAMRYRDSWHSAIRSVRQLIIRSVDAPMLKHPLLSVGGVRSSPTDSMVRIDSVSHLMAAMSKGLQAISQQARVSRWVPLPASARPAGRSRWPPVEPRRFRQRCG